MSRNIVALQVETLCCAYHHFCDQLVSQQTTVLQVEAACCAKYSHHLDQQINTPTRITEKSSTLIDLLFTNNSHRVIDKGVISSPLSDHCLIFCVIKSGVPKARGRTIEYRSYKHYSKQEFLKDLRDTDWDQALNKEDIDSAVGCWNKLFTNVAEPRSDKEIKN